MVEMEVETRINRQAIHFWRNGGSSEYLLWFQVKCMAEAVQQRSWGTGKMRMKTVQEERR